MRWSEKEATPFPVENPADGSIIAWVVPGSARTVAAAQPGWAAVTSTGRGVVLARIADADLDCVAADFVEAAYDNKGEACTAASRLLVERSVR